jgi:hypothetical protein
MENSLQFYDAKPTDNPPKSSAIFLERSFEFDVILPVAKETLTIIKKLIRIALTLFTITNIIGVS